MNVGGSVSFTTAQYLRLFDGVNSANFYANPANDGLANSVLAVAPVVDFGFLSPAAYGFLTAPDPSATITVQGSALSVLPGQSISLVGGKVVIRRRHTSQMERSNRLSCRRRAARFTGTAASPGELSTWRRIQSVPNVDGAGSFTSSGSVSLAPGSSIDVSGDGDGVDQRRATRAVVNEPRLTLLEIPSAMGISGHRAYVRRGSD